MSVQLAAEIWNLLNDLIPYQDRDQFADGLVNILMDNGIDVDEIREEFMDDTDVKNALKYYTHEELAEEESEYCDEDADDSDW